MSKLDFSAFWSRTRQELDSRWERSVSARQAWLFFGAVALVATAWLMFWTPDALPNGDAAVYAQQIQQKDFSSRPVHLGYYLLMAGATGGQDAFSDLTYNRLHGLLGGLTVALLGWIAAYWVGGLRWAWWILPMTLGHFTVVRNLVWAEVYGPQTCFLIASFLLMWKGRCVLAGFALAVAVLITPSSLFMVPALVLLRPDLRSFLQLGFAGGIPTLAAILPVYEEYFWGDRGLFKASGASLDFKTAVLKEGFEVLFGVFGFFGVLAWAGWVMTKRVELRPFLAVFAAAWLPNFLFGEKFRDVPVQLTLWVLLIPVAVLGLRELANLLQGETSASGLERWAGILTVAAGMALIGPTLWVAKRSVQRFADVPSYWLWLPIVAGALVAAVAVVAIKMSSGRVAVVTAAVVASLLGTAWVHMLVSAENHELVWDRQVSEAIHQEAQDGYQVIAGWSRGILHEHYVVSKSYAGIWLNPAELHGDWGDENRQGALDRLNQTTDAGREIYLLSEEPKTEDLLSAAGYEIQDWEMPGIRLALPARP